MMKRLVLLLAALLMALPAMAAPENAAAIFAAEHLPGYTFVDGVQFDETAMLLVEDEAGFVYFAGCVRDGKDWTITMSTPFPEWMDTSLDTFHAGEVHIRIWLGYPEEQWWDEIAEGIEAFAYLEMDGTWRISGVNTGWEVISFNRHSIALDVGFEYFCDMTLPLDITRIDWAALPRSFEEAMAMFDVSRWGIVKGKYTPVYVKPVLGSAVIYLMAPGAPVKKMDEQDGMVQVRLIGRNEIGWMLPGDLYSGEHQRANYEAWCEDPDVFRLQEIILDSSDPAITWYAEAHDNSTARPFLVEHVEYLYQMGWCSDTCCCLLYSETLGSCGYVPIAQLPVK